MEGLLPGNQHLAVNVKRKRRKVKERFVFQNRDGIEVVHIPSDNQLLSTFEVKKAVGSSCQLAVAWSEHEVLTETKTAETIGINHVEGGWPKDISYLDMEQTSRFRKKTEKDEGYPPAILQLESLMEHGIHQNNAIDIYQNYFSGNFETQSSLESPLFRPLTVLREPSGSSRATTGMSWGSQKRLAVAYSDTNMGRTALETKAAKEAYIWDISGAFPSTSCPVPELVLHSPSCPVCVEFNPKDPSALVAGCASGQVVYWDVRRGSSPVEVSSLEVGHRDCVKSVLWLNAKTGTEFFSASIEGLICWWDIRKLSQPIDTLLLDPTRGTESSTGHPMGATVLEFEPSMSTKFMVGTELGTVFLCNSKAKSIQEKLTAAYPGHLGNVVVLQRNPMFPKNFLTVGDWTAKIWSEDVRESHILWSGYRMSQLTYGCWSPTRPSVYFVTTAEGILLVWDLLVDHRRPIFQTRVTDSPLCCTRVHESGRLLACGALDGRLALIELHEDLATLDRNDKSLLTATFDRETKREKIIEGRSREQRLKIPQSDFGSEKVSYKAVDCEKCLTLGSQYREDLKNATNEEDDGPSEDDEDEGSDWNENESAEKSELEQKVI